jgi:Zn finger protein HypA/HybF involved in hydrogenase expression
MHDILLAKEIFDAVVKCAKKNRLKKVARVKIGLGRIEDHHEIIRPADLKFNFRILAGKSPVVRGAKVVIRKIRGLGWSLEEIEGL